MKSTPLVQFSLLGLSSILTLLVVILRPNPNSLLFWSFVIPGCLAGLGYTLLSRAADRFEEKEITDWNSRLAASVDIHDFEDDGHLHEYFTPQEREKIISELNSMPKGSRSLKRAIEIVNPEIKDENGA